MSQAPWRLPRGRPARRRPLPTLLRSPQQPRISCSLTADPLPLSTLGPPPFALKIFRLFIILLLFFFKNESNAISVALATWHSNPFKHLLCAGPLTWSFLFTLELLRSPWPLGMVLSAPEKPFLSPLCPRQLGEPLGPEVHRARGSELGGRLHVVRQFLEYSP